MSLCYYCKKPTALHKMKNGVRVPNNARTVDHKVPLSRGGRNVAENKVVACYGCNTEKGKLTEAEYRTVLYYRHTETQRESDQAKQLLGSYDTIDWTLHDLKLLYEAGVSCE